MGTVTQSREYKAWLTGIKAKLRKSQLKAAVSVNTAMLEFYWELGAEIVKKQEKAARGAGFLEQLSKNLMHDFPEMKGFSHRNLKDIRKWYTFYQKHLSDWQEAVVSLVNIPWGHNVVVVTKCRSVEEALFYVAKTIEHNWSRSVLVHQIESGLFHRRGEAATGEGLTSAPE